MNGHRTHRIRHAGEAGSRCHGFIALLSFRLQTILVVENKPNNIGYRRFLQKRKTRKGDLGLIEVKGFYFFCRREQSKRLVE
jgi:hypothetical protein